MRKILTAIVLCCAITAMAQTGLPRVYDEKANPLEQIDQALTRARAEGKFVVCQVGGNWCPWCLRFADFAKRDTTISRIIEDNFVFIHVNYDPRNKGDEARQQLTDASMKRLGNPMRFGFPVFVVLNQEGRVIHTQDSSFLEEGNGYSQERVIRFFKCWTPEVVK